MNDLTALKSTFKDLVANTIHRDGIDKLMLWLESTDFYNAPSSTRYHGAEPGGLIAHSIDVYKQLKLKQTDESDETIAIVSLFHDICKVNMYKVSVRNTKDSTGKWIQVPFYETCDDEELPVGHGEKSVIILMKYMNLTDEEICSIRWHMSGFYALNPGESNALSKSLIKYKLVLKLIESDMESSFWNGK